MNKIEKYAKKTYVDKDYKDICIPEYLYKEKLEQLDKYKNVIDKIKEYVKENIRYYDDELGLVEIMGAGATRIPVLYLYGLLELLEEIE